MKIDLTEARNHILKAWGSAIAQIRPIALEKGADGMKDIADAWLELAGLFDDFKVEAMNRYRLHNQQKGG